ncbi:MAG: hypothetical protein ACRELC_07830 [Gemmatimonadota bacterium]
MSRTAVFIDGGYLNHLLRDFGEPAIAFDRFAAALTGQDELLRVCYYDCPPNKSPTPTAEESARFAAKQRFFHAPGRLNRFTVRQGQAGFPGIRPRHRATDLHPEACRHHARGRPLRIVPR